MTTLDLDDLSVRATAAAQAWAPGCEVIDLTPMEGGTVGLVYSGTVTGGPSDHPTVVLKVAPPGLPPLRNRDVLRQARCIGALGGQPGVGVPPLLFSDEGQPDDIPPFFASGMVAGECAEPLLDAQRNRRPDAIVQGRAHAAVRMLAALHRVDPGTVGLGDEPVTTPIGEVDRWTRTFDTVPDEVRTGYVECADALRRTAPEPLPDVVVHGDYRLGNMLSEGTEVRAIIDWEIWSRSDPRIDLSWFLFFTEEAGHPVVTPGVDSGMPSDADLLAAYEAETGRPVADLGWFHALTRYKEAAAMALIAKLAARRGDEEILGRMSEMLPALIRDAHQRVS
jgi:aminoglycoside phosphotransferase (APT) family kinase protein